MSWHRCCDAMRAQEDWRCDDHGTRQDCPDALVGYTPHLREHGLLIHDGGGSTVEIRFCPWCGDRLPASLRDRFFEELAARGLSPGDPRPAELRDDRWWRALGL